MREHHPEYTVLSWHERRHRSPPVMSAAFTPEQLKYLQDHSSETRVPSIHISNGICVAAATIAVVLRFCARRLGRTGLGKDDYCLFLAYVGLFQCRPSNGETECLALNVMSSALDLVRVLCDGIQRHDTVWHRPTCKPGHRLPRVHHCE